MTEGQLKEYEMWARQAVRDHHGNIPKLGQSILDLTAELRRLQDLNEARPQ